MKRKRRPSEKRDDAGASLHKSSSSVVRPHQKIANLSRTTSTSSSHKPKSGHRHYRSNEDEHLPLPFPSHLPRPHNDFLRDESPYQDSYQQALKTAYEGFVVDESIAEPDESDIQGSLLQMSQYFRRDVTQPFGLGTKCAKTYVTRCVVGDCGTTYKYLGLRMFSVPWSANDTMEAKGNTAASLVCPSTDCQTIWRLGQTLANRTVNHLQDLNRQRQKRGAPPTRGRGKFDICLINRMEARPDLKDEPSLQKPGMKTLVSWHADSSLEHYSTIAVYQTLLQQHQQQSLSVNPGNHQWYVALRVAHHSEGPEASKRGTDIASAIVQETPPIAASLPSGSAYYLLDDFNHHHQHTVLSVGNHSCNKPTMTATSIRYSCTFRLLRESHNVHHMLRRCQTTISNFHKKGAKLWRAEQLLLTELESEWIHQFFIQGSQHYNLLCKCYWKEPLSRLLQYWSQLEHRTKQTIDILCLAAIGKATRSSALPPSDKATRKARDRQKKALMTLEDISKRGPNATESVYESLAGLLEERATMRELWCKREQDPVFSGMKKGCQPMPIPFDFESSEREGTLMADGRVPSPLIGTSDGLRKVAMDLRTFAKAYASGLERDLPVGYQTNSPNVKQPNGAEYTVSKDSSGSGWRQVCTKSKSQKKKRRKRY